MNKKEIFQSRVNAYTESIKKLSEITGTKYTIKFIVSKLARYEREASKASEDLCNIPNYQSKADKIFEQIEIEVQKLFNNNLKGFFVNTDPRGYALKISDKETRQGIYKDCGLHQDGGGYGCLYPTIEK